MTLTDRLSAEGYEVESVGDAPSAIETAANGKFDALDVAPVVLYVAGAALVALGAL